MLTYFAALKQHVLHILLPMSSSTLLHLEGQQIIYCYLVSMVSKLIHEYHWDIWKTFNFIILDQRIF